MTSSTHPAAGPAAPDRVDPVPLERYADAFTADGPARCWRHTTSDGRHGAPTRCPNPVDWAGWYDTRNGTRYRVWSCDGHLDGGHTWICRPPADPPP